MAKETTLSREVLRQIQEIKSVDLVVGIPTYNNAETVGYVLRTVSAGLATHFPELRSLVVHSDGGSRDATKSVVAQTVDGDPNLLVLSHLPHPIRRIIAPYSGSFGRSHAIHTFFEIADSLGAKALAFIDASSRSISGEWVHLLTNPVLSEGYDLVTPLYMRHKYDGTITSHLIYPLIRALYGKRIRQPVGDDFGFSGRLVSFYLRQNIWRQYLSQYGLEIWLTGAAVSAGFKTCQSFLGPKVSTRGEPGIELSSVLNQVMGTLFALMESNPEVWSHILGSEPITVYGFPAEVGLGPVDIDAERMIGAFRLGLDDLRGVWNNVLTPGVLENLTRIAEASPPDFMFADGIWVKTIFEFAAAFHKNRMSRDHLIKSLTPIYLGRIASFVLETQNCTAADVENKTELLCLEYENQKPYLIECWHH
jgi:hypothetical protein